MIFTRHAKNRMRRDGIGQADVEGCLHTPDFERQQGEGKKEVWKSYRGGFLKVVCRDEGGEQVIVTITVKKNRPTWAIQ
jgi:hypothetical protein